MDAGLDKPADARRGSVLLAVLLFSVAVAAVSLYAANDSLNARQINRGEESYANGLSAAEYGAELAVSEIAKGLVLELDDRGEKSEQSPVTGDWVLGAGGEDDSDTLHERNGGIDPEQRRIRGVFNEHEFRVRVRSTRQAYEKKLVGSDPDKPLPAGWLWRQEDFQFGSDKAYEFRDVYEITSTARPRALTENGTVSPVEYSEPVVQAVIEYIHDSPLADLMRLSTVFLENPDNYKILAGTVNQVDFDAPITGAGTAYAPVRSDYALASLLDGKPFSKTKDVPNILISGEDHFTRKANNPRIVSDRIVTPMRLSTNEERFFAATGGYWTSAYLTLNFIDIDPNKLVDRQRKYKEVSVVSREGNKEAGAVFMQTVNVPVANTLRPASYDDYENYSKYKDADNDGMADTLEGKTKQSIPTHAAMISQYTDGRTVDTYLLGGKKGKTVNYVDFPDDDGLRHRVSDGNYNANGKVAMGVINATTNSSGKFSIVLGAFEDLPRLYINMAGGPSGSNVNNPMTWSQMYVGQYTKAQRTTTTNVNSMPLLQNVISSKAKENNTWKIRPQTIQTLLNGYDEMLVREYELKVPTGKNKSSTVYFAYPAFGTYYYYKHKTTGDIAFVVNNKAKAPDGKTKSDTWGEVQKQDWKTDAWKGNYTWAYAEFNRDVGYRCDRNVNATVDGAENTKATFPVQKVDQIMIPRQFFWQELVGYSLVKDWSTARYGEPALIDDGLGYPEGKETNPSSRRTIPYEDPEGNRIIVGFDEAYQRNPTFNPDDSLYDPARNVDSRGETPAAARWKPKQPDTTIAKNKYPTYLVDAWDPIYVRAESGKDSNDYPIYGGALEKRYEMNDFLYEKTFILSEDSDEGPAGTEIKRDALCLFIGYEDQTEFNPGVDYNYHDMLFSIYVAPEVEKKEKDIINIAATSKQWWERDEVEGLSGRDSHPALGFNMLEDKNHLNDEELRKDYFKQAMDAAQDGGDDELFAESAWTMHGSGGDRKIDFPRAAFEYFEVDGRRFSNGRLDETNEVVERFLKLAGDEGKAKVFYYTKADLVDYMQFFVKGNDPEQIAHWYDNTPGIQDWRYDRAVEDISGLNPGITLRPIEERWLDKDGKNNLRTERAVLATADEATAINPSSTNPKPGDGGETVDPLGALMVSRDPVSVRKLAGDIVGSSVQPFPHIRTEDFTVMNGETVRPGPMGLIAGEIMHDADYDMLTAGIVSDREGIPVSDRLMTFPEAVNESGDLRRDRIKSFLVDGPADMYDRGALDEAAEDAVEMVYKDYFAADPGLKKKVQEDYGIKEQRYSFGFHRSGKEFEYQSGNAQDRMEISLMGVKGFNPFRMENGGKYIADEKLFDAGGQENGFASYPNYPLNEDDENPSPLEVGPATPTFVFDRPIDGAGALVVDGNLHIKSTFAYYGVLIVLGDLIVEPRVHADEPVYNSEGHAVDAYGNAIYADTPIAYGDDLNAVNWEYDPDDKLMLEENDMPFESDPKPATQNLVRGELIVQGAVAVKGRIITKGGEYFPYGSEQPGVATNGAVHVYWSKQAVEDAASAFSTGGPAVRRISWTHDDDIDVESLWQNRLDGVAAP